ncbi:glycosyltransferase family 1 protein [Gordonia sp. TBRC 11910]|uniref:Glycosyltransferase family 1 protein n=1 Tax=Gordonia asplenii TaxID=2725283 RepID=A0A848L314_9ACTN|nr:glycosyltransferase [Gordonia asplenii]NMO05119.1 glycosyltransferase family 1 protein [Gordonia asplenii]
MADIIIATYGSRGDILPLTDFAARLQQSGHSVVMTASTEFADDVTDRGIPVRPVDFQLDAEMSPDDIDPLKAAREMIMPKGMKQLGDNLLDSLDDVPADLVVLSPFAELAGHPFAEFRGIPSIGARLQPLSATAEYPPALMGAWSAGAFLNRRAGRFAASALDRLYAKTIASFRDRLGLPGKSARAMRKQRTAANWPILHGYSPSVLPKPRDWRDGLDVAGYWWPAQPTADWVPPEALSAFLDAGDPPIFIGLGSLMVSTSEAKRLSDVIGAAVEKTGTRAIVQSGGVGLDVAGTGIVNIGAAPYDWLFPRVAAVGHSCGAGTTASALRAGVPTIAIPSPGGDQPFWAERLRRLGVSPAALPRPKLGVDALASAIDAALTDPTYQRAAQEISHRIDSEDGGGAMVKRIEELLGA